MFHCVTFTALHVSLRYIHCVLQWQVGMRGLVAYRPDVCSRRIVSLYTYLWISTLVIQTLIAPSVWLIKNHSLVLKAKAAVSGLVQRTTDKMTQKPNNATPGPENDTAGEQCHIDTEAEVKEVQSKVVAFSSALVLTAAIFSSLAPLLLLWCLFAVWFQLYAASWLFKTKKATIGSAMAEAWLVQLPAGLLCILYHLGVWCFNGSILFDLQFGTPVKFSYLAYSILEAVTTHLLWRRAHNTLQKAHRNLDDNTLRWLSSSLHNNGCEMSEESPVKLDVSAPVSDTVESRVSSVEDVDATCTWWFGDCMSRSS